MQKSDLPLLGHDLNTIQQSLTSAQLYIANLADNHPELYPAAQYLAESLACALDATAEVQSNLYNQFLGEPPEEAPAAAELEFMTVADFMAMIMAKEDAAPEEDLFDEAPDSFTVNGKDGNPAVVIHVVRG